MSAIPKVSAGHKIETSLAAKAKSFAAMLSEKIAFFCAVEQHVSGAGGDFGLHLLMCTKGEGVRLESALVEMGWARYPFTKVSVSGRGSFGGRENVAFF